MTIDFQTYYEITQLYAAYAAVVDQHEWDKWPEFFTDDCHYRVQARENYERKLPLALISLESKGMLKDRIVGATDTIYHDPYYQRHVVGVPRILDQEGELIRAEANYSVFRTRGSELSTVFNVGRYIDEIVRTPEGLKLASRICVYDSELVPNSLIYPI